jgi:hypothetical protein
MSNENIFVNYFQVGRLPMVGKNYRSKVNTEFNEHFHYS